MISDLSIYRSRFQDGGDPISSKIAELAKYSSQWVKNESGWCATSINPGWYLLRAEVGLEVGLLRVECWWIVYETKGRSCTADLFTAFIVVVSVMNPVFVVEEELNSTDQCPSKLWPGGMCRRDIDNTFVPLLVPQDSMA